MTVNDNYGVGNVQPRNQHIEPAKKRSVFFRGSNNLDRNPQSDELDLNKGKKEGFFQILGKTIKQSHQKDLQSKEIEKLNKTCEKLIDNLQETKKDFQEIFLRKDITDKETLEIIKRYHKIELIGITGSKDEYTNLLFEEAKKNYGFENLPISLNPVPGPIGKTPKTLAFTTPLGDIFMRNDLTKKSIFNVIHHELRHVKQNYYAFNYNPDEYIRLSQPKNMEIPKDVFEDVYGCTPDISNIDDAYIDFARKSFEAKSAYCPANKNMSDYIVQWCEDDAYNAGNKMEKLFS